MSVQIIKIKSLANLWLRMMGTSLYILYTSERCALKVKQIGWNLEHDAVENETLAKYDSILVLGHLLR